MTPPSAPTGERKFVQKREAAVALLAADALISEDFYKAEAALNWARNLEHAVDTDPMWAKGRHEGDCTKTAHTCCRCVLEEFEAKAEKIWRDEGMAEL